jgi:hypothetical protein
MAIHKATSTPVPMSELGSRAAEFSNPIAVASIHGNYSHANFGASTGASVKSTGMSAGLPTHGV